MTATFVIAALAAVVVFLGVAMERFGKLESASTEPLKVPFLGSGAPQSHAW